AVGTERSCHKRIWVKCSAKGIDALDHCTVSPLELEYGAPEARIVNVSVRQHRVIDRLPLGELDANRFPVTLEIPHLDKLAALPVQPLLVPVLAVPGVYAAIGFARGRITGSRRVALDEAASLEFHEDILAVNQRHLVVREEITASISFFGCCEWIV